MTASAMIVVNDVRDFHVCLKSRRPITVFSGRGVYRTSFSRN
jgi:hypothetical protein